MRKSTPSPFVVRLGLPALLLMAMAVSCTVAPPDVPQELADAIAQALPDLEDYRLVTVDDEPVVAELEELIAAGTGDAAIVELPAINAAGNVELLPWIAYHVNVRDIQELAVNPDSDTVAAAGLDFSGPSATFRGIPDWSDNEFFAMLEELEEMQTIDESILQPSVLNIIGGRLEGARYGGPENQVVSVLDHLHNALELHFGMEEAERLAGLTPHNYLLYRHQDLQPPVAHGETEEFADEEPEEPGPTGLAQGADAAAGVRPLDHTAVRTLRPVMVADDTIYDPTTNTWLISNWFARVDAAANRQNAYLLLANIAPDISSGSFLTTHNNRIYVRTQIAGYLVLTPFGKSLINPKPSASCGGSGTFIDLVRTLSNNYQGHPNEYWMWWTRHYGGGCAYIRTLTQTPQGGAVGWSGYGSGTVDWTSFVFMHESGHIIGGTHVTNTAASPETVSSHRCRLFGFWPVGPTGPSLMSYASGTRTYCFAATPSAGTPKRNLTKTAEYLHFIIQP